jgi:8-oxo-dGTP pyrophosphatase MutT (NUDIX family)
MLLRETAARLEILLTRRSAQLSFMGDVWVFPGGRLDESDVAAGTLARIAAPHRDRCGHRLLALSGVALEPDLSLGLHVAGCRETFEECGVLLARHGDGSACGAAQCARLDQHRSAIAASGAAFLDMLQAEGLFLDVDRLVYWSHWITPSHERKRFDTRFFAVEVPPGQDASVDRTETTEHAWVTVEQAFARASEGTMKLSPPTLATLQDLRESYAQAGSVPAMLARERQRVVPPILPKWFERDGRVIIVLPWDPEYSALPGDGVRPAESYPPYLASLPSRRVLEIRPTRAP